jgi:alkylhydroperoxidase family enzyme
MQARMKNPAIVIPEAMKARRFDERALAGLVLAIATTNVFNRLNVSTRQPAGAWG